MNRKSILIFNMVFILTLSFFNTKIVYGYTVHIKDVLSEHVKYDPDFYGLPESTYIYAGVTLKDIVNPSNYTVEVKWDTNIRELPFQFYTLDHAFYMYKLGYVPPTSFDDWDNKTYTLYVNDTAIHTDTIADGALRELSIPEASYNGVTKTISWNSVEYADGYAVRILNSTNVDDLLFNSGNLGLVNQYTFKAAYHSLLDSGAILSVEAWDYTTGPRNMNNISIYVTDSIAPVKAFVTRFYELCLSRLPDEAGLNAWVSDLLNGSKTGSDVAYGFVFSDEFLNKNITDAEYLQVLYEAFFNRQSDSAGLQGWLDAMNSGASREEVLNGFIYAAEFAELCEEYGIKAFEWHITKAQREAVEAFVTRFYQLCLDRDPDAAGLDGWANNLLNQIQTGADVAHGFIDSVEFVSKNTTNDEYLTILYKAFFNRDPDQAGWDVWLAELNSGKDRGDVLNGFLGSQEFIELCEDYGIKPN